MKICYLYIADYNTQLTGVDLKVKRKFEALKEIFPQSLFVQFDGNATDINRDEYNLTIPINYPNKNYFKRFFNTKKLFNTVNNFISDKKDQYDFFILRYPLASLSLMQLINKNKNKIIFEHNTNELAELKLTIKKNKKIIPFSCRPSILSYYISDIYFSYFIEKKLGKKILKSAAGGICVTPEIEKIEKEKYPTYDTIVISNGLNKNFKQAIKNKQNDKILKGVFIAGTLAVWHGIDRIIRSFVETEKNKTIELYFVGKIDNDILKNYTDLIGVSIFIIDYLNKNELHDLLNEMHFAIGTCALHKTELYEGAVLKVREYLSVGLPVVIGYHDPYINSIPELKKYCLNFKADDSLLDFQCIDNFIRDLYNQTENLNTDIQEQAFKYLSWEHLLKPLPKFLNQIKS